jgi:molybdopterin synthase catalytic subunit
MADTHPAVLVRVSDAVLDAAEALSFVADPAAGGTCIFVGTVRDHSDGGAVRGLHYEAWRELADRRLGEIADEMLDRWPCRKVVILHRFGDLAVGDTAVIVAASAAHRDEAFAACRHGIERTKDDVPIWKKEHLETGEAGWVMGS